MLKNLNNSKQIRVTEWDKFKDLNCLDVGICKIKFEYDKSLLDRPEASGPNINPIFNPFFLTKMS